MGSLQDVMFLEPENELLRSAPLWHNMCICCCQSSQNIICLLVGWLVGLQNVYIKHFNIVENQTLFKNATVSHRKLSECLN